MRKWPLPQVGSMSLTACSPYSASAGVERPVEDERLDEDRSLEQGEPLLRVLGEVLVEVAEEPGVARRIGEVEHGRHHRRCRRSRPRLYQSPRGVARDREPPQRVVRLIEQTRNGGEAGRGRKARCSTSRSVSCGCSWKWR